MTEQGSVSNKHAWINEHRKSLFIGVPTILLGIVVTFYLLNGRYQATDDAYVQAAQVQISCNISGRVTVVAVQDNQKVKAGTVLFQIDDKPFKIAVAEASARLANAQLQINALKATYQ